MVNVGSKPHKITLALSVTGGGDAFGPFFATLVLDKVGVEQLLRRADVYRVAKGLEPELYQMTYFDYQPEFFESKASLDPDPDFPPEYSAKLEAIFEEEDYPTDGLDEIEADKFPEGGNVRRDYCKLMIAGSFSEQRPGMVDFHWIACIKHTDVEINTAEVTEEVIRAMLGRL
jgi:hypothetical protein